MCILHVHNIWAYLSHLLLLTSYSNIFHVLPGKKQVNATTSEKSFAELSTEQFAENSDTKI